MNTVPTVSINKAIAWQNSLNVWRDVMWPNNVLPANVRSDIGLVWFSIGDIISGLRGWQEDFRPAARRRSHPLFIPTAGEGDC